MVGGPGWQGRASTALRSHTWHRGKPAVSPRFSRDIPRALCSVFWRKPSRSDTVFGEFAGTFCGAGPLPTPLLPADMRVRALGILVTFHPDSDLPKGKNFVRKWFQTLVQFMPLYSRASVSDGGFHVILVMIRFCDFWQVVGHLGFSGGYVSSRKPGDSLWYPCHSTRAAVQACAEHSHYSAVSKAQRVCTLLPAPSTTPPGGASCPPTANHLCF